MALINLTSYVRYQVREVDEWLVRNSASWSPAPGGSMEFRLTGNHLYDTRTDTTQLNVQIYVLWRLRASLRAEGSLEAADYRGTDEDTSPINGNYRITWQF